MLEKWTSSATLPFSAMPQIQGAKAYERYLLNLHWVHPFFYWLPPSSLICKTALAFTPLICCVIQIWMWWCFSPRKKIQWLLIATRKDKKIFVSICSTLLILAALLLYLSTLLSLTGLQSRPSSLITFLYQNSFLTLGLGISCPSAGDAFPLPLWLANSYLSFDLQLTYYFTKIVFSALRTQLDSLCISSLYLLYKSLFFFSFPNWGINSMK